ncbi:hypothetical protein MRX96_053177 [Rhipicephalus microplus]
MTSTGRATEATLESLAQAGSLPRPPQEIPPSSSLPPTFFLSRNPSDPSSRERPLRCLMGWFVYLPPPRHNNSTLLLSPAQGEHGRVVCYGRSSSELCR